MQITIDQGRVTAIPENNIDLALLIKEINSAPDEPMVYECKQHAQVFQTPQGLAIHKARMHKSK